MAPTTPVSNKKARGLAAQKVKEPLPIETDEFVEEFHAIEKDLKQHILGSVKVFRANMTFAWKQGQNRDVVDETRSASLMETMRNGLYRLDPVHRMSGTVESNVFKKYVQDAKSPRAISMDRVKEMNDRAEFPFFNTTENIKIEMQSGQHRMKILQQI